MALGTVAYGFLAVLLVHALLARYFTPPSAFAGAALIWLATHLYWYTVHQPAMSHALSAFAGALFLSLWDGSRMRSGSRRAFLLGLAGGLAVAVRWQNAILLLLPAMDWLRGFHWERARFLAGASLAAGTLVGVLPQLLAWKAIFGVFILPHPPQGADYIQWDRPFFLETLFSSRHGLLAWTPVLWLGFLGFIPLVRRRSGAGVPAFLLGICLAAMTYLNMCVADWWGGGSFGSRRFDASLPILAFGIAASFESLCAFTARRPALAGGALLVGFPLWNFLFMEQYRRYWIEPDDTVSFVEVAGGNARILFEAVGSPFSWPANWLFAWEQRTSPARYDRLVGRYLSFRNNNLGGAIDLGEDDGGLIGEGWRRPERREGTWVRHTRQPLARLFVPLEAPRSFELFVRASSRPGDLPVAVQVNGREVGRFLVSPGLKEYRLRVNSSFWEEGYKQPRISADAR